MFFVQFYTDLITFNFILIVFSEVLL